MNSTQTRPRSMILRDGSPMQAPACATSCMAHGALTSAGCTTLVLAIVHEIDLRAGRGEVVACRDVDKKLSPSREGRDYRRDLDGVYATRCGRAL